MTSLTVDDKYDPEEEQQGILPRRSPERQFIWIETTSSLENGDGMRVREDNRTTPLNP